MSEGELVDVGDVRLRVLDEGRRDGPVVVLLHGFPELAYSWRHQIPALAGAGYRVLAPDNRGVGGSDRPEAVEAYAVTEMAGDVVGLIDWAGASQAVLIGHDWGADVAWKTAWMHPDRISAVAGLSVPFLPRAPAAPTALMREHIGEDFYIVWFQEPGVGEAALERDVRRTIATTRVWGPAWAAEEGDVPPTPPFMTDEELAVYVDAYTRTGFSGGLALYRNLDRNWELTAPFDDRKVEQPALFLTGERDPVRQFMPPEAMDGWVIDLRAKVVVPGAGHWVNQERPDEVNAALLDWLGEVAPV
ncbi:MAG TPA: alpha/beta hydrolase [Solirubrobacteraceae bacterium]|nr:alpha/beta hydrolase [Solirubrobacteraceae bacterium]